jgi:hypothetical protein
MKHVLLALSSSLLLVGCAGVKVADTQVASGAVNPSNIYIRPFEVAGAEYKGSHRGGRGEEPIRQSLAGRAFANALKDELEKMAPAMVIEDDERPTEGWLVDGSLDMVDGGSGAVRGLLPFTHLGPARSKVLIHVRIREVGGGHRYADKDSGKLGRRGNVIYEFDLTGGSKLTGAHGQIHAPGMGDAEPFDYKNAAERVLMALSTDPHLYGVRTSPVIR